ncbi:MAG TPA: LUD domain-containing protein [Candidatus Limnocylindria bacterium]|nr:LUD domain-containing protein [Candidatus Limnocylindria bacterium]
MQDRSAHFARKAVAVGAVVTFEPDADHARSAAGHDEGDRVADALFAVAETGSVAVALPRAERGQALLSERLWLLVPAAEIVATLDQALARIDALVRAGRPYVTLMTGPSRTADIERALTVGVHGPRELHVVLVG